MIKIDRDTLNCSHIRARASINPPATLAEIRSAEAAIGFTFSPLYVALLQCGNGFMARSERYSLLIYSSDEIAERNATYEVAEYLPELIMIGDDGGGRGIFIAHGSIDSPVYRIEMGSLQFTHARVLAVNLAHWVNHTFDLGDS